MIYDPDVCSSAARWRLPVCLTLAALALGTAAPALANGRFPESQRLLEHPGNPDRLYLTATFGLLVTEDRGKNWYTICEEAFALKFLEGDPLLEVMPDGSLIGGIYDTLNRSTDCGCTWKTTLAAGAKEYVVDLSVDRSTGAVLALVADSTTLPTRFSVFESMDRGQTWKKLSDLPVEIVNGLTIDVAPSNSSRVYVSGLTRTDPANPAVALLAVSNDHGATWQTREIQGAGASAGPYIAAVDATHPDRLYVRTDEWLDFGDYAANDALLYSDDAGQTWRELDRRPAKLFGFALSPDGATVLIGYGDPVQSGGRTVNADEMGIYRASTSTFSFAKIFAGAVGCLRWTSNGLYTCLTENHPDLPTPGMSLGFSPTVDFTLATQTPLTSLLASSRCAGRSPAPLRSAPTTGRQAWTRSRPSANCCRRAATSIRPSTCSPVRLSQTRGPTPGARAGRAAGRALAATLPAQGDRPARAAAVAARPAAADAPPGRRPARTGGWP